MDRDERVQYLKENVPMELVIEAAGGQVYGVGHSGWTKTSCPFHGGRSGDRHPSAGISPDSLYFMCHGCEVRGDIFGVLQAGKVVQSFPEAIEWVEDLARNLGVPTTGNS